MERETKISISLKVKDMFYFLLRHNYSGFSGIFGIFLSVGALVLFFTGYGGGDKMKNVLLLLVASLFLVVNPLMIYFKASRQVKGNPMFKKPLQYNLNKEGVLVSQEEEELPIKWEDIRKVIETRTSIIIYLSVIHAYILPKDQLREQYLEVKESIGENVDSRLCKWKKTG